MKNEKPVLIILTPGFAADETDSTCLPVLQTFLKKTKENFPGLKIIVFAFHYPFFKRSYLWNGIEVISFNGRSRRKFYRLLLWQKVRSRFKKVYKQNDVMGILSIWYGECAWLGKQFSRKYDLKHYCWLWGQDARVGNKYVKRYPPSGNELIALSDFLQSEFEKNYSIKPAHVIPPGIDAAQFNKIYITKDIDVLGTGSLIPLKQYNIFIDIISELKKHFPNIRFVLCGKGPEEYGLQKQIERLHLQNNISLTGELAHHEVLQLMQRSKIFLHTSSYEGFGYVCLEALFAGAQVISFCKPMKQEIKQWQIVDSKEEMIEKAIGLLSSSSISLESIHPFDINHTVRTMMDLFSYKEEIIS